MVNFHNADLWIAWMVLFCMEGSRLGLHTGKVCVGALDVTVSQSSVQVARGQAAILPCSFTTSAALTNLNVIWMVIPLANANQPEQVIIYQGGQVFSLANHLQGRVGFVSTQPSTSASIVINNTALSDTGTYQCLVNNLPDRGGRNIGVIGLTVLVPPSVPSCAIQGSLDVGSDIVLLCGSEEGIPTPSYSWEKMDSLPRLPANALQDQMQGTVSIRNISTSTSGLYQCSSSNVIGKSTCLLNVQVVAPQPQSVGLIAGTVATGVLALIIVSLLVTVTLFYWRNRNKYDEEEIPNEIREDDLPPKRSSSAKAFHGDASSSENDTLTSTNTYNSRYWHNPTGKSSYDTHNPTGKTSYDTHNPTGKSSYDTHNPTGKSSYDTHNPTGKTSYDTHNPTGKSSYDTHNATGKSSYDTHNAVAKTTSYDTHSYTRYNGDTHRTFSSTAHGGGTHGHAPPRGQSAASPAHGGHSHGHGGGAPTPPVAPGSAPLSRHAHHHHHHHHHQSPGGGATATIMANGSHTLPPPKTLVVTTNSAPSPPPRGGGVGSNGSAAGAAGTKPGLAHSYAVSQATLERMGAVPVMVPAQSRAGSLV